jgi:hypothetical protein
MSTTSLRRRGHGRHDLRYGQVQGRIEPIANAIADRKKEAAIGLTQPLQSETD